MKRHQWLLAIFLTAACCRLGNAQAQWENLSDAQTGRPPWGAFFEGGLDSVNLYNGNVMLDLPLFSLPGRELSTGLRLSYNSQNWEAISNAGFPYGMYTGGWRINDPIGERPFFYVQNTYCWPGDPEYSIPAQEEWRVNAWWIDGFGTKHRYSTVLYTEAEECYMSPPPSTDNLVLLGDDGLAYDGSEMSTGTSMYDIVLRFPSGMVIEFTQNPTIRTPNGNYWSRNGNGLPDRDTLDRQIGFESNKGQANPWFKRYTVIGGDGTIQTYQLNYRDGVSVYRPNYYGAGWITMNDRLESIDLPGNQHYLFEYNHDQGFLTKVTLPTGATITYTYLGDPHKIRGDFVGTRTLNDGTTLSTWQFSRSSDLPGVARDVTVTYPEGNYVVHKFDTVGLEYETVWKESWGVERKKITTTYWGSSPSIVTTIQETDQRRTTYTYITNPQCACSPVLSQVEETDWAAGSPGAVLSRTNYSWSWPAGSLPYQQLNAVELRGIDPANPGGLVLQGKTEYFYDQYALVPLVTTPSTVPNKGTPSPVRGNLTTLRSYSSDAVYVEDRFEYDDLGNIVRHIDPLNHAETFDYTDQFANMAGKDTYAYLTQVTNALGHTSKSIYHYGTGLVVETIDPRNNHANFHYDGLNRPTQTTLPNGLVQSWAYDLVARKVTTSTNLNSTTESYLDKFARVVKTTANDPAGTLQADTEYDGNGRVKRHSQPYQQGPPAWNTSFYDALNRVTVVNGPDGTPLSQNSYYGNWSSDGSRSFIHDGLGRLAIVYENAVPTNYTYYVFGSLHSVIGQGRTFTYDWLGRQTSATNPESGTVNYQYNAASLVTTRTDARGVVASYNYDAINRLTSLSYSGGSVTTPGVTYNYDQGATGLLTSMQDGLGTLSFGYNAAGQVISEQRTFTGVATALTASYTYDFEGKLTHVTYPSGRGLAYTYESVGANLASARDETVNVTVVSGIARNQAGLVTQRTLGNGIQQTKTYNALLQMENMKALQGATSLMDISYAYSEGRIGSRTDAIQPEHSAAYAYDDAQRLLSVTGTATDWSVGWEFDGAGNRRVQTPSGLAAARINPQLLVFDSKNQISNPSGFEYDEVGNLTYDSSRRYYYDAESRLIKIDNTDIQYAYDGQGRRARKTVTAQSTTVTTYYFYGQLGLMSEFSTESTLSAATAAQATDRLQYRLNERTGTALLLMDASGTVRENNRVLPYGEPWTLTSSNLQANDQQFTTYQRDDESGLDYAMARYYGSRSGRFMSADPGHIGAVLQNPKTWNAYVYAQSDPINWIDPTGLLSESEVCYFDWDTGEYSYACPGYGDPVGESLEDWEWRLQNTYEAIQANLDFQTGRCSLADCLTRNKTFWLSVDIYYNGTVLDAINQIGNFFGVQKMVSDYPTVAPDPFGKETLTGILTQNARDLFDNAAFFSIGPNLMHKDIDGQDRRARPPNDIGPSLQVVYQRDGAFYADIDRFYAGSTVGAVGHIFAEVLSPRISGWLGKIFR